jgi:hypothetical protein
VTKPAASGTSGRSGGATASRLGARSAASAHTPSLRGLHRCRRGPLPLRFVRDRERQSCRRLGRRPRRLVVRESRRLGRLIRVVRSVGERLVVAFTVKCSDLRSEAGNRSIVDNGTGPVARISQTKPECDGWRFSLRAGGANGRGHLLIAVRTGESRHETTYCRGCCLRPRAVPHRTSAGWQPRDRVH